MPRRATHEITERFLRELKPDKRRRMYAASNCPGLNIRVEPSGTIIYYCQSTPLGGMTPKAVRLGTTAELSLEEAMTKATASRNAMRQGKDPFEFRRAGQIHTVETVALAFTSTALDNKRTGHRIAAHIFKELLGYRRRTKDEPLPANPLYIVPGPAKNWVPGRNSYLRDREIKGIDTMDLILRLNEITATPGRGKAARDVKTAVRSLFSWALSKGIYGLRYDPAKPITDSTLDVIPNRRDRVLTSDELRRIWNATSDLTHYDRIVRLILATACRRNELGRAQWPELEGNLLMAPTLRMKMKKPFIVPFIPAAMALLPARTDSPYIFPNSKGGAYNDWHRDKAKLYERSGTADWRPHDLRHTMRTAFSMLKVRAEIAEAILSHAENARYNHWEYVDEKREVLQLWWDYLMSVVEPAPSGNVVKLRA